MGVINVDCKRQIWKVAETVAKFPELPFATSNSSEVVTLNLAFDWIFARVQDADLKSF